jgi:hypothetical protein
MLIFSVLASYITKKKFEAYTGNQYEGFIEGN